VLSKALNKLGGTEGIEISASEGFCKRDSMQRERDEEQGRGRGRGRREECEVESVDENEDASIAVTSPNGTINLIKPYKLQSGRIWREVEKKRER
jgi:hypothetical protein